MYAYAYVQRSTVVAVEKRTLGDGDPNPIGKYYHSDLLPYFIPVMPGENAPQEGQVGRGWVYQAGQFSQPEPFALNPETGELYLPPTIPADQFWQLYQGNLQLQNQLAQVRQVANTLLLEQLVQEGAVTV